MQDSLWLTIIWIYVISKISYICIYFQVHLLTIGLKQLTVVICSVLPRLCAVPLLKKKKVIVIVIVTVSGKMMRSMASVLLMLFPVLILQDGGQKCIPSDDFECEEVRRWNYTPLCSDTNQRDLVSFWRSCLHSYKLWFCVLSCSLVSFFSHQPFGLSDINKVKNQMRSTAHQVPKKNIPHTTWVKSAYWDTNMKKEKSSII